jgi:hypothetical protein
MMKTPSTGIAVALIALWLTSGPIQAASLSSKTETVKKYLDGCLGKPSEAAGCDKQRKEAVEILKEDLHELGSSADPSYTLTILPVFNVDEPELRIAAADALGMIGPQDSDVEALAPLTNDPVPDVRQAVSQMLSRGKGPALVLLKQRALPLRIGRTPDKPADTSKIGLPVAPNSSYWFDSSDVSVGRLSYVTKNMNEVTAFYKGKAKKGPFPLQEFKDKYRYQFHDEDEAMRQAGKAETKQMETMKPPDPKNVQAFKEYMEKIQSIGARQGGRMYLDAYEPKLFGSPTVYVLEERQIGQRSYPSRYVVLYQEEALKKPGYRLAWMTVSDDAIKSAQVASLEEEKNQLAHDKESEAAKKRGEAMQNLIKKKDEAEKKSFKKGQSDLEKELGF